MKGGEQGEEKRMGEGRREEVWRRERPNTGAAGASGYRSFSLSVLPFSVVSGAEIAESMWFGRCGDRI
jgi:hypothetical protein